MTTALSMPSAISAVSPSLRASLRACAVYHSIPDVSADGPCDRAAPEARLTDFCSETAPPRRPIRLDYRTIGTTCCMRSAKISSSSSIEPDPSRSHLSSNVSCTQSLANNRCGHGRPWHGLAAADRAVMCARARVRAVCDCLYACARDCAHARARMGGRTCVGEGRGVKALDKAYDLEVCEVEVHGEQCLLQLSSCDHAILLPCPSQRFAIPCSLWHERVTGAYRVHSPSF